MSSIKIRCQSQGNKVELKILLTHPMENGRNRDQITGELIPPHFITELTISLNNSRIITVYMAGSMAKNPFFTFYLQQIKTGDNLKIAWLDNLQLTDSVEYQIID